MVSYLSFIVSNGVSDPHPLHADPDQKFEIFSDADPDPGCEKFADPGPGLHFYQTLVFFTSKKQNKTLDPDRNADPDPDSGTQKMRIRI